MGIFLKFQIAMVVDTKIPIKINKIFSKKCLTPNPKSIKFLKLRFFYTKIFYHKK